MLEECDADIMLDYVLALYVTCGGRINMCRASYGEPGVYGMVTSCYVPLSARPRSRLPTNHPQLAAPTSRVRNYHGFLHATARSRRQ